MSRELLLLNILKEEESDQIIFLKFKIKPSNLTIDIKPLRGRARAP